MPEMPMQKNAPAAQAPAAGGGVAELISSIGENMMVLNKVLADAPSVPPEMKQRAAKLLSDFEGLIAGAPGQSEEPEEMEESKTMNPNQGARGSIPMNMAMGKKAVPV